MKKYNISPELKKYCLKIPYNSFLIRMSHLPQKLMLKATHVSGIKTKKICVISRENKLYADIFEASKAKSDSKSPCLIYIHGGGFGLEAAPHHKRLACQFALETGCRVVFPYYRLLPRYPYPAARNDITDIYRYICRHSKILNIDTEKIAVAGDSAGGTLAVYLCLDAEKSGLPSLCGQLLLYPVIDADMKTPSMHRYTDTPLWNSVNNMNMWKMYLHNRRCGKHNASPLHMELPSVVPPTYIETAEFDCLHDEGVNYADKLKASNRVKAGEIELYETKGTMHGYDIAFKSTLVKKCMQRRTAALRRFFYSNDAEAQAKIK